MKYTLLQIVQSILSDMDSENVYSISDTVEAEQVASIVRDTFYNIISTRKIPEHQELLKVIPNSDSEFPTHFQYGEDVKEITNIWYEDNQGYYKEVCWLDPLDFLSLTDKTNGDYAEVYDKNGGTKLRISKDKGPEFYTSFDDNWIVMNSYDETVDTTLQASKVRALGTVHPVFALEDSYVADLDSTLFPYFIAEAKSTSMSLLKGTSDAKVEQTARRQKAYIQNDLHKTKQKEKRPMYGRR